MKTLLYLRYACIGKIVTVLYFQVLLYYDNLLCYLKYTHIGYIIAIWHINDSILGQDSASYSYAQVGKITDITIHSDLYTMTRLCSLVILESVRLRQYDASMIQHWLRTHPYGLYLDPVRLPALIHSKTYCWQHSAILIIPVSIWPRSVTIRVLLC
jgi:hypothetical protein